MYEGTKHSSASSALRSGTTLERVQRALAHADPRSTERYAKLDDQAVVGVFWTGFRPQALGMIGVCRAEPLLECAQAVKRAGGPGTRDSRRRRAADRRELPIQPVLSSWHRRHRPGAKAVSSVRSLSVRAASL